MKHFNILFLASMLILAPFSSIGQIKGGLKKLRNAAKSLLEEEKKTEAPKAQNPNSEEEAVRGKKLEPVDIEEYLNNASAAISSEQWTFARYETKGALKGIEVEIGYKLLESMPTIVSELSYNPDDDGIVSTGIGLAGLLISRSYGSDTKEITGTIGNNSAVGAGYGAMANASYASNDDQHKNIMVQGYKGSLTFDGYNSYQLGVTFGQSSIFILECEQCTGEEEIMDAASAFDISKFESTLKDQGNDSQQSDAATYISSAKSKYDSKNLEGARSEMQRALAEIDIIIGKLILEMLPTEINGLTASTNSDEYLGTATGFGGIYINRVYESADKTKSFEINLVDDSPMIGMISGLLSNPLMVTMSGKKSITIDGYKGMMEAIQDSDPSEINIDLPINQSMLSMTSKNLTDSEMTKASNLIPVGKIFEFIK